MKFDPLQQFTSEQRGYVWLKSLAFGGLVAAAVTPWILLTHERLNAGDYASSSNTVAAAAPVSFVATKEVTLPPRPHAAAPEPAAHTLASPLPPQRATALAQKSRTEVSRSRQQVRPRPVARIKQASRAPKPAPAPRSPAADVVQIVEPVVVPSIVAPVEPAESKRVIPPAITPKRVDVSADASDPDGDPLTFRWSAPVGSFTDASAQRTVFTCPEATASVRLTVAVTDSAGAVARDTVTVQCGAGQR